MKTDKKESTHDTLAFRLANILMKLNSGDSFTTESLALEFKVHERTCYRDMIRLGNIIDKLPNGRYQLAPEYRGKLKPKDLEQFAKLVGVENLFPSACSSFLIALLDTLSQNSLIIKSHHFEHEKPNDFQFSQLDNAIRNHQICHFVYAERKRVTEPYKLINNKGIWYLAATEAGKLKTYSFSRISQLSISSSIFKVNLDVEKSIGEEDDIWFNPDKTEVLLSVAPQIAYYFQRRKLLPMQETVRELENGGLIMSSKISHPLQILPQIRYWLPNIRIISPDCLQLEMESELRTYLAT
jgi:predicted DNA-binding transcriptional regulator YafY